MTQNTIITDRISGDIYANSRTHTPLMKVKKKKQKIFQSDQNAEYNCDSGTKTDFLDVKALHLRISLYLPSLVPKRAMQKRRFLNANYPSPKEKFTLP